MLGKLKDIVGRIFKKDGEAPRERNAVPAASSRGRSHGHERKPLDKPALDSHIKKLLSSSKKVSASKLQVISLDKVKEYVEGDWGEFADKVRTTITSTIMKRLGPKDAFSQLEDDSYMIIFDNLSKEDAELECVLIMQEVLHTLFADRHLDDSVDIRTVAVGVDGKIDVEEVDLLNVIARLLQEEQIIIEKKLKRPASSIAPASSPEAGNAKIDMIGQKHGIAPEEKTYIFDFDRVTASLPENLRFKYRPAWDVKRKVLSTYSCIVTDGRQDGYAVLGGQPDPMLLPALDYLVIGRAAHELKILHDRKTRLLIYCPVHINTLADVKSWGTYRILCERLAKENLKKDLVFEIFGVDNHTDSARLIYCAGKLKSYCKSITIRTDLSDINFSKFDSGAFDSLCADVTNFAGSEKRQMKLMDDYVERAHKKGLNAYITGLSTLSQTTAAIASGFQKVAGDAIYKPIEKPEFVFRFEAANLLSRFAGS